jgi:hypothetical protein
MLTPSFAGLVTDDLKLKVSDRPGFLDWIGTLKGKPVEVIVREPRSLRSLELNKYWHAVPFALMAQHWAVSVESTKAELLGECFGWEDINGRRHPVKPHTSELSKDDAHWFTEWMPIYAMTEWNVTIPMPNEVRP